MKKLWISFAIVFSLSFAVLGWIGTRIYQEMPPIPATIVSTDGTVVVADGDIGRGQNVWQALGGMEVGSIWGHGSYVAPDWTADWLHREATFVLNDWANAEFGTVRTALRGRAGQAPRSSGSRCTATTATMPPPTPSASIRCAPVRSKLASPTSPTVFMKGNTAYAIPPGAC